MVNRSTCIALIVLLLTACSDDRTASPQDAAPEPDLQAADVMVEAEVDLSDAGSPPDVAIDAPPPPTTWVEGPDLMQARTLHSATLLDDGRLLVAGGIDSDPLGSAELYDPASGSWSSAGEMKTPHWGHAAHLLPDGRVLIVGGCSDVPSLVCTRDTGTEIYDPSAPVDQAWTKGPPMFVERRSFCSTSLDDGRVVVVGGFDHFDNHTSIEIFDPRDNSWSSPAAALDHPQNQCAATLLDSKKVLISGGFDGEAYTRTLLLFDPATGALNKSPAQLKRPRSQHAAIRLRDKRVLIVGGECRVDYQDACTVKEAELYDPVSDAVSGAGSLTHGEGGRTARLAGGEVMSSGGVNAKTAAHLYDPAAASWSTSTMPRPHWYHSVTVLGDNSVIVVGGSDAAFAGTKAVDIFR